MTRFLRACGSWLLLALICCPGSAGAAPFEDRSAHFVSIGDSESIPDGVVGALAQDRAGFLWIGTTRGLVRYDGYELRRFRSDRSNPHSLGGNLIRTLKTASDGRLLIGTDADGLSVFDPASERFDNFRHDPADADSLPPGSVLGLAEAPDGTLWLGTRGGGLARLGAGADRFERIRIDPDSPAPSADDFVHRLLVDRRGDLWVGGRGGLARLSHAAQRDGGSFERIEALRGETVYSLLQDREGRLWAGTQDGELAIIDPETMTVTAPGITAGTAPGTLDTISDIVQTRDGEVWLARASGLEVRDAESGDLLRFMRHDPSLTTGLAASEIRTLLQDRSGLLWLGGFGSGVQRHDPGNRAIRVLRGEPGHGGVFQQPDIGSVLQRRNGEVWIGTRGRGVAVLDADLQLIRGYPPRPESPGALGVGWITALAEDEDGTVWLGSREGLLRYDATSDRFTPFEAGIDIGAFSVRRLAFDRSGRLWIATGVGMFEASTRDGHIRPLRIRSGEAAPGEFNAAVEDGDGTIWMAASNGLFALRAGSEEAERVIGHAGARLPHPSIVGLLVDSQDRLWVDTVEGPFRMQLNAAGEPGFAPATLNAHVEVFDFGANMLQDQAGRIWTQRYLLLPEAGRLYALSLADGVDFGTGWFRAYTSMQDGRLLFGGSRGLLVVDPARFSLWDYAPPVTIAGLRIDGEPHPPRRYTDGLTMAPGDRQFALDLTAFDYSAPERLRYAYRLDGVDADWVETDASRRTASYRNLWPGTYDFHARATNRSGDWSPHTLTLRVEVLPAWWQTRSFQVGSLLMAGLLLFLIVRLRTRAVQQRAAELEALVRERTDQLSKAKEDAETALHNLQRAQEQLVEAESMASLGQLVAGVAHEINTPIGIALTAASHLQQVTRRSRSSLASGSLTRSELESWQGTVEEGSGLIVGSLQRADKLIGSFKQVAVDQSSEQRRRIDLPAFLEEVRTALSPSWKRTPHRLDIDCPDRIELDSYPGALFQVLTNLINNSLTHAFGEGVEGRMRIAVTLDGDRIRLSYSDNGAGMRPDIAAHAFDPFFTTRRGEGGSGLGLHLVHNLCTQMLGGSISLRTASGEGSRFDIVLPLRAPEARKA